MHVRYSSIQPMNTGFFDSYNKEQLINFTTTQEKKILSLQLENQSLENIIKSLKTKVWTLNTKLQYKSKYNTNTTTEQSEKCTDECGE